MKDKQNDKQLELADSLRLVRRHYLLIIFKYMFYYLYYYDLIWQYHLTQQQQQNNIIEFVRVVTLAIASSTKCSSKNKKTAKNSTKYISTMI